LITPDFKLQTIPIFMILPNNKNKAAKFTTWRL